MTIDERLERLIDRVPVLSLPDSDVEGHRSFLKNALLAVARDQRAACAENVMTVTGDFNNPRLIDKESAQQAVLNATIK